MPTRILYKIYIFYIILTFFDWAHLPEWLCGKVAKKMLTLVNEG